MKRKRLAPSIVCLVLLVGCSTEVNSEQVMREAKIVVRADLGSDADESALAEKYIKSQGVAGTRGEPGALAVYFEPDASVEDAEAVSRALFADSHVEQVRVEGEG